MKAMTRSNNSKKVMTAIAFTLLFGQNIFANTEKTVPVKTAFEFAGKINNSPVFRLAINNETVENYSIKIRDVDGEVLYTEKVKGAKINRTFQLDAAYNELIEGTTIEVINLKDNRSTIYKIETTVTTTQNLVVAEL
jgi:hypothetical protein